MKRFLVLAALASLSLLVAAACGPGTNNTGDDDDDGDGGTTGPCNPNLDQDGDGIRNGLEGCEDVPARDSDGDGMPDWQDTDSDNDGIADQYEDRNGDGVVGTCTTSCVNQTMCAADHYCSIPLGGGIGHCVSWECLDGETDPHSGDTDGDGTMDGLEGTWVCNPMSEDNPNGLKPIRYVDSVGGIAYSSPNWKIALEVFAVDGPVPVANPTTFDSAYIFDYTDPAIAAAGFMGSRPAGAGDIDAVAAAQAAYSRIDALGNSSTVLRAAGTRNQSLDGHDTVLAATILVTTSAASDATAVRQQVLAAVLGRPDADLTFPPVAWTGASTTQFAVVFQTEYRADAGEVVYMGAVTALADFDDDAKATGFHVDDLANGTGLTHSANGEQIECEQFRVAEVPKADIIWVIDESGSMSDDRANVAMNATAFFNKAVLAGLDFRLGVTDMHDGRARFALRAGTSTGDRWILPSELTLFQNGVNDPSGPDPGDGGSENGMNQGRDSMSLHLPRNGGDAAFVRPDAKLVTIYVTDEHADEVENAGLIGDGDTSVASAAQKMQFASFAQPYIQQFVDNDAVAHLIGVPEANLGCSGGGAEIAYGYLEMVSALGGQFGSICQADLGATMDAIIDDIVGAASPVVLEFVPISATISVVRDNVYVPRSRSFGWDYRASSNSIIFNNMPFDPLSPSDLVVSYRRWEEQVPIP